MFRTAALLLCAMALHAADDVKKRPELTPALQAVIDLARTGPPEFLAQTTAWLVETGRISSREIQVDLLTEGFRAAARAHTPARLTAIQGTPGDTRAIYLGKAGELNLDALSLESRVLKALVTVDRAKARELFDSVPRPSLDPQPCEDPLVADASPYYDMAGTIAQSSFTAAQKEKGEHVQFMVTVLAGARSPNELAAFARAVQSVDWKPAQWDLLLSALANKLQSIGADYRPFALSFAEMRSELDVLVTRAQAMKLETAPLTQAFRSYLMTQLTGPRCAEDLIDSASAIAWFNNNLRGASAPMDVADVRPSKRVAPLKAESYFNSDESRHIRDQFTGLQYLPGKTLRSPADKLTVEWKNLLSDFLRDLAAWTPSGSEIDVFHQKASVLLGLLQQVPPGDDRDRILGMCAQFMRSSGVESQYPAEWLWQAKAFLDGAGPDSTKLMQSFQATGDAGLTLYPVLIDRR